MILSLSNRSLLQKWATVDLHHLAQQSMLREDQGAHKDEQAKASHHNTIHTSQRDGITLLRLENDGSTLLDSLDIHKSQNY